MTTITQFMKENYRHFNSRETLAAARGWKQFRKDGGQMLICMAGAMSTAELGVSLARVIRSGAVSGICATGANLEEDLFRMVPGPEYVDLPEYRHLSARQEEQLEKDGLHRVTDTCIPYDTMMAVENTIVGYWQQAAQRGEAFFPDEYAARYVREYGQKHGHDKAIEHSWVAAAVEKNVPIFTPGWEDSSLGCAFTACVMNGKIPSIDVVKTGIAQAVRMVEWYRQTDAKAPIGLFQIGGGIAGDFAICIVPLILHDLKEKCRRWQYFAQIADSTTSYGSYSGAVPNEKITWAKISPDTPAFMIESDATIVAPLIFNYLLDE